MSFKPDKEMVRNIILDHYENPKYKKTTKDNFDDQYFSAHKDSPSCIDDLTAFIKLENNKITDVKFDGISCAIATSSTDMIASQVINKSPQDALKIITNYLNMIDEKKYDKNLLGELFVFQNVSQQINRIKCAKVGIIAIQQAIEKAIHEK